MSKQDKINLISLIILGGFCISVFYHYAASAYAGLAYPYSTFLFQPGDKFMDFVWPVRISGDPYQIARPDFQNFPFLYRIASVFTAISTVGSPIAAGLGISLSVYLLMFVSFFGYCCYYNVKGASGIANAQHFFTFTFMSYPFLIAFDRANFEMITFMFLYLFVFLYNSHPRMSLVFLSSAIAMKAFPAVFLVLLVSDRRLKHAVVAGLGAVGLTLVSYLILPGGIVENITRHLSNLHEYTLWYAVGIDGVYFGNSLFGALKFLVMLVNPATAMEEFSSILATPYAVMAGLSFFILSGYLVLFEKVFWKRVGLLVFAMNLLPFVSGDYKLLYIFIPLFLFIGAKKEEPGDMLYTVLFALLLVPKDYFRLSVAPQASISVVLSPAIMGLMSLIIIATSIARYRTEPTPPKLSQTAFGAR